MNYVQSFRFQLNIDAMTWQPMDWESIICSWCLSFWPNDKIKLVKSFLWRTIGTGCNLSKVTSRSGPRKGSHTLRTETKIVRGYYIDFQFK